MFKLPHHVWYWAHCLKYSEVSIGIVMVQQQHHHRVLQVFAVVVFSLGSQICDNKAEHSLHLHSTQVTHVLLVHAYCFYQHLGLEILGRLF